MLFSMLLLLCSPRYKTGFQPLLEKLRPPFVVSLEHVKDMTCSSETTNGGLSFSRSD